MLDVGRWLGHESLNHVAQCVSSTICVTPKNKCCNFAQAVSRSRSMKLRDYLTQLGDSQAARTLGLTERAVRSYRCGARLPKPETARKIIKRTKGAITMQDIYGS